MTAASSEEILPLLFAAARYAALFLLSLVFLLGVGAPTNLSGTFPWQFRLAARLRTPILVFVVVPLSFARWAVGEIRGRVRDFVRAFENDGDVMAGHDRRVSRVVEAVKAWDRGGRKRKLRTARPSWMGMSVHIAGKEGSHRIEVRHLNHVLEVDNDEGGNNPTVTVEPGVTMGDLTRRLLPLGLMLDLHVEMESVTAGGAAMGFGIETNSHASGFFQEAVTMYELVDSHGTVRTVTTETDPELFRALPWSHGSLGFLTALTIKCARVKPYVHVRYIPTSSRGELTEKLRELTEGEGCPRFVEATVFSEEKAVIQVGDYRDAHEAPVGTQIHGINHFWKPFYYRYVEGMIDAPPRPGDAEGACHGELIPLKHYTHRFTRSVFWELEDMIPFSNHPLYRLLWGWLGAPEVGLLKLAQGPVIRQASVEAHVVQESIAPLRHLAECIEKFDSWFGCYPLLVFPVRIYDRGGGMLHPRKDDLLPGKDYGMFVDLGAYGVPRPVRSAMPWDAKSNIRAMEHWTREKGGFQALYTDVFHTRKEFRDMFDHGLLDRMRGKPGLDATDAFDDVYDRIKSPYADLAEEDDKEEDEKGEKARNEGTHSDLPSENGAVISSSVGDVPSSTSTPLSSRPPSPASHGSNTSVSTTEGMVDGTVVAAAE